MTMRCSASTPYAFISCFTGPPDVFMKLCGLASTTSWSRYAPFVVSAPHSVFQ